MATTREVRRGECWLRLHQLVLLRSRRNIRSTVGNVKFSSEQHKTDPDGHEGRHQSNLRCVIVGDAGRYFSFREAGALTAQIADGVRA